LAPVDIIKGVDLDINDGEFVVFVGPSGCGKSTLLRMIAGLETSRAGAIEHRRETGQRPVAPAARHRHGVPVLCALSAHDRRDNMAFGLKMAKDAEGGDRPQGQRGGPHPQA
jgi:ABC-type sugar transport system ATPase subunit